MKGVCCVRLILFFTVLLSTNEILRSNCEFVASVNELSSYFRTKYTEPCSPKFAPWVLNDTFITERTKHLAYEMAFNLYCSKTSAYILDGTFQPPDSCNTITLCNTTYCLTYGRESVKFIYSVRLSCVQSVGRQGGVQYLKPNLASNQRAFESHSMVHFYDLKRRSSDSKLFYLSYIKNEIQFQNTFGENVDNYLSKRCDSEEVSDLFYEGHGELPNECSELTFCDMSNCFKMALTGNAYSYVFRRREDPNLENMELPGMCEVTNALSRKRRGVWRNQDEPNHHRIESDAKVSPENPYGLLRFNLPGYYYCGPG